ncbi:hypothetical protein BsWGS_09389 [Bradybaena similaris]
MVSTTVRDYCVNVSCNNGNCTNTPANYTCVCNLGWTGDKCDSVIDYCASVSCNNGSCINTPTNYTCMCNPGWMGDICDSEFVLWPDYINSTPAAANTTVLMSRIPFAYFNRASTVLNVNPGGYVSIGGDFISTNMPNGTAWPYSPDLFGIYWSDIEILNKGSSSFYITKIERLTNSDMNSSSLIEYVKKVVNVSSFEPLYLLAVTWVDAMPRPAVNFSNDKATFQLILASDTKYSYAIRNYQQIWGNLGFYGRPRVSAVYTLENGSKLIFYDLKNKSGKLLTPLFTSGTPSNDPYVCVQKTLDVNSNLSEAVRSLPSCPCHVSQAKVDGWFSSMNDLSSCYQSVFAVGQSVKQKCCYNRYGLLNVNSAEASVPVQENGSGLQDAFHQCCNKAPQLCSWFYNHFPSTDCSLYKAPYIAGIFGRTYTVTFDNNKYSFNGLGDFILFESGEIQIQMRTQINENTNTTSIEALAIKAADNTSSFQFYVQSSNLTWNFTSKEATKPDSSTYKILQSLDMPSITLWLPTIVVTAKFMNGSISFSIMLNGNNVSSQGLLGFADGNPANDFKFRNGTVFTRTAETLSIGEISEFVLSWQVRDASESLFDSPSLPANNSAGFMPLQLPANVAGVLAKLPNDSLAEVRALCQEELFCVQEYYITNSTAFTSAAFKQATDISELKKQTSPKPPTFANTDTSLLITNNGSLPYTLSLMVKDNNMHVTFSLESSFLSISSIHLENSSFTWNVSADLTELRMLSYPKGLKFYATSDNLSAEYAPTINLCLCEQASQCRKYPTNDWAANDNVNLMLCDCGDRAEGMFCEIPVDVCTNCYNITSCNATKLTDYCAPCPSGYGGDGKYCADKDECSDNKGGCEEFCTNTAGSFECSCKPSYTVNGTRCIDIDECLEDENICQDVLKICTNQKGGYSCSCYPTFVGKDKCIKAPYTYVGEAELANTAGQAWNPNLSNKKSTEFIQLSDKFSRSIQVRLVNGNIGNNATLYVEVTEFRQAENAARTKRQTNTTNSHVIAVFVVYLTNNTITADEINRVLREGNATICNGSCQYNEIIIVTYPQINSMANLCNYPDIHKCDMSTTVCVQSGQKTGCTCKTGYDPSPSDSHSCRDIDECSGNNTAKCPQTGVCINQPGSYMCWCNEGQYWDTNTTQCAADGCAAIPCQNGVCYPLKNSTDFTCKCNSGWEGSFCENEDAETHRFKVAVICVSVILGVLCLILLIILIVICVRKHRTLENDSYTNSRYSEAEHLPRVKIAQRPGTEMSENGQGSNYERLGSGSVGEKQTFFGQHAPTPDSRNNGSKAVYDNRAYDEDFGERL